MLEKVKNFFDGKKGTAKTAVMTMSTALMLSVTAIPAGAETTAASVDWSTIITNSNVGGVLDGVTSSLPVLMPIVVSYIAIRKGISFIFHMLHKA